MRRHGGSAHEKPVFLSGRRIASGFLPVPVVSRVAAAAVIVVVQAHVVGVHGVCGPEAVLLPPGLLLDQIVVALLLLLFLDLLEVFRHNNFVHGLATL